MFHLFHESTLLMGHQVIDSQIQWMQQERLLNLADLIQKGDVCKLNKLEYSTVAYRLLSCVASCHVTKLLME